VTEIGQKDNVLITYVRKATDELKTGEIISEKKTASNAKYTQSLYGI
jgi:hypothetical protein